MKPGIAITAPLINGSTHGTAGFRAIISSCNIQTHAPVAVAGSRRSAPAETSAASRGGKARPCLTALWRDNLDRKRIASSELLLTVEVLPHLECSRAAFAVERWDEGDKHGDAGRVG